MRAHMPPQMETNDLAPTAASSANGEPPDAPPPDEIPGPTYMPAELPKAAAATDTFLTQVKNSHFTTRRSTAADFRCCSNTAAASGAAAVASGAAVRKRPELPGSIKITHCQDHSALPATAR